MLVAANLAWLVPGRVGGSEEYTSRLLAAVIDEAPAGIDLRIIGSPALFDAYPALAVVEHVVLRGPVQLRPWRVLAESTQVHRSTAGAAVVHHFGGRIPARTRGNDVVTIHDLQPLQHPDNFSVMKRRYLAAVLPRSVRGARVVTTPSEWVASTVIDRLGADPSTTVAVSSTWDPEDSIDSGLADSLGDGPMVLYPAVSHPHKRHRLLLDAVDEVVAQHGEIAVVLTGGPGRAEGDVDAAIARSAARVLRPGRVPAAALRGLYQRADALVFPSEYEGFGLPVLEAMRAGVPVVAANRTALPEIVADTGVLVDSDEPADWAAAIIDVLAGGDRVKDRIDRARIRAERWSPEQAAARLIDVWRSLG